MDRTAKPVLLTAKFFRPTLPPQQVPRTQLVAQLEASLNADHPLTLISASAGYGKSTLAAEWLAQVECPAAWLSLEEADDEPLRFFSYFVAALRRVDAKVGTELALALDAGQLPPQEVIVATLVNDLVSAQAACVLALDDFQWIQDPAILAVLEGLLTHHPPGFHLLIITREDPALPLARWRAKNRLTEIRAADLRFNSGETSEFLRQGMGLDLPEPDLAELAERTEGWAAGLQLAALALKSAPSSSGRGDPSAFVQSLNGSHRFILSYLTEEVLRRQPPEVQAFLLQTSILARLTGALCDALTDRSDGAARLESLLAANLFLIPLDDEGHWYRYHHLFADLLQTQLRRTHPEQVIELHRRASRWFEAHDLPVEALEHALATKDFERVMDLLEVHIWQLLVQGYVRRIEAWMQAMPDGQRPASPRVNLGLAWLYLLRGDFGQVASHWQQAAAALADSPEAELQAECLALQANLAQVQGNLAAALDASQRALHLVNPNNWRVTGLAYLALGGAYRQAGSFAPAMEALQNAIRASQKAGDAVSVMLAVAHLTLMCLQHGRLRVATETAAQSLAWLQHADTAPPPIVGAVYGALGLVYYEWNEVEQAHEYFERGIKLGTFSGHNASVIYTKINLARLLQAEEDYAGAERTLADAEALFRQGAPGWVRTALIARQVNLLVAQDRLAEAEAALRQSGVTVESEVTHQTDAVHLAWLRLLSARQSAQAAGLARRIVESAEVGQRHGTLLQALVWGAQLQALDAQTRRDWLARALTLAEPEGYLRTFVDEGAPLAALLRQMARSAYIDRLLACFPPPQTAGGAGALVEPLTERELEVLHMLAEGLKYAEIAKRLIVSINTVRYHVKGLYGKLGVDRQAHAIERARELRLL